MAIDDKLIHGLQREFGLLGRAGFAKPAKILEKPGPGGFFGFFFKKNPHFHPGFLQNAGFFYSLKDIINFFH